MTQLMLLVSLRRMVEVDTVQVSVSLGSRHLDFVNSGPHGLNKMNLIILRKMQLSEIMTLRCGLPMRRVSTLLGQRTDFFQSLNSVSPTMWMSIDLAQLLEMLIHGHIKVQMVKHFH